MYMNLFHRIIVLFVYSYVVLCPFNANGAGDYQEYIIGTHYTGETWAPSFWSNLDESKVHDDFLRIRENGFNTIIVVVPWVGFQKTISPVSYFEAYLESLAFLFEKSKETGLKVILRVGYAHEVGVDSTPDHNHRILQIASDKAVQNAWFDYLGRINEISSRYDNFLFAFLSWEDFFLIDFAHKSIAVRTYAASVTGYQEYLKKYTLGDISSKYGTDFSNYSKIPIPQYTSPAIHLYHEFWDQYLTTLMAKSQKIFPNLSMEVRADCDPTNDSSLYVCHGETFDSTGGKRVVIYYTPALGAENCGDLSSSDDAAFRLQYLVERVRSKTKSLIFLDQFNFIDNTPEFKKNTRIAPEELSAFIDKAQPILKKETIGYALWAMQDVKGNLFKNGSFERELLGWSVQNATLNVEEDVSSLRLNHHGKLRQHIKFGVYVPPEFKNILFFTLNFKAKSVDGRPSTLNIQIIDRDGVAIHEAHVAVETEKYERITVEKIPLFVDGVIHIDNKGSDLIVDEFELYYRIQENGIYDIHGNPKEFCDSVLKLNKSFSPKQGALCYYDKESIKKARFKGVSEDGWCTDYISGYVRQTYGKRQFVLECYLPESWKGYGNRVSVKLDGVSIGASKIIEGYNKLQFHLTSDQLKKKELFFEISTDKLFEPSQFDNGSQDQRKVSFVLVGLGVI
ncbi:hypothetical protein HRM2_29940 [Desulforapulum autotrophicum HRM2]|uniref:Uncharacterized protein n=1 Tax=Desulforapulum autotrophicum (strain ATCC 43914 / DSM 3382 / VKM B-1955 / HRM2) TaxID=177437 RepID=C0QK51_DESAH|nr:hypothetical protein HRM2_29940 [Desulforapulum autotrophicum HRM2]